LVPQQKNQRTDCWWTRPGGGESGGRSNNVVIGRWTNPQQAGGDGHVIVAPGENVIGRWEKYRGNSVEQLVLGC